MNMRFVIFFCLVISLVSCRTAPPTGGNGKDTTVTGDTTHVTDTTHHNGGGETAIDGIVLKGPISPVERPGVSNSAPLAGAKITIAENGAMAKPYEVTSDTAG